MPDQAETLRLLFDKPNRSTHGKPLDYRAMWDTLRLELEEDAMKRGYLYQLSIKSVIDRMKRIEARGRDTSSHV